MTKIMIVIMRHFCNSIMSMTSRLLTGYFFNLPTIYPVRVLQTVWSVWSASDFYDFIFAWNTYM